MKEKVIIQGGHGGGNPLEIEYDIRFTITRSVFQVIIGAKFYDARQYLEKLMVGFKLCHLMSVGVDLYRAGMYNLFANGDTYQRYTRLSCYHDYIIHIYRWFDGRECEYVLNVFIEFRGTALQESFNNFLSVRKPEYVSPYQRDVMLIKSVYIDVVKSVYDWLSFVALGICLNLDDVDKVNGVRSPMYSLCKSVLVYKLFLTLQDMKCYVDTNRYVVVSIQDTDVLPKDSSNMDILYVLSVMSYCQDAINQAVNQCVGTVDCMTTVSFDTLYKKHEWDIPNEGIECPVRLFMRRVMLNDCIDVSDFYNRVHQYWCSLDTFNY